MSALCTKEIKKNKEIYKPTNNEWSTERENKNLGEIMNC